MEEVIFDDNIIKYIFTGLEEIHIQLLKDLSAQTEPVTYKRIRTEIRVGWSQALADKSINRLLGSRFIQDYSDPNDKRNLYFRLTQNGKRALIITQ